MQLASGASHWPRWWGLEGLTLQELEQGREGAEPGVWKGKGKKHQHGKIGKFGEC